MFSECYFIVMPPALCCWPCWWIQRNKRSRIQYRDQRAQTLRRSSGPLLTHCVCQVSLAELYNLNASVAVVSLLLWGCKLVFKCVNMQCVQIQFVLLYNDRFSDLLIAQIRQRWGHNLWMSEFRFQVSAVTKLFQHRNNVNSELRTPTDRCNKQAIAVSLCLHKHVGHMSKAPRWQAELFMCPVKLCGVHTRFSSSVDCFFTYVSSCFFPQAFFLMAI